MLVMAHWKKTPKDIAEMSEEDLEIMEQSFLLLERRQSETLDSVFGALMGVSWDAASLLGEEASKGGSSFTWSNRQKRPKVFLPLTVALTQNPKFFEQLKSSAAKERWGAREDTSILDRPKWVKGNVEYVDLSTKSKEEFLKFARRAGGN